MRYAEYRPTSTTWVESIPVTWDCKKISALFSQRKTNVSDKDYPALSVTKIGIVPQLDTAAKTDAGDNRKLVCTNDFVINSRSDRKGSCGVSELDGSVSLINIVLTPRQEWNNRYVHYLLRCQPFSEEYYRYGRGIVSDLWTTRYSEMKNILLPVPPRTEQDQIVRYLDWQVSKINKLIAAKKKEIDLIKEIRNTQFALCAGTKRIKLKRIVNLSEEFISIDTEQLYRKTGMYNRGRGIFQREAILGSEMGDSKFQKIRSNCILISGQFAWEGAAYITSEKDTSAVVSHRYYLLKPNNSDIPVEYIWSFLMSERGLVEMQRCSHGAAGRNRPLNIREFLNVEIPIPSQTIDLNVLMKTVQTLIELNRCLTGRQTILRELKSRIISDVVTGQIDVRGIEVPDFEMVEETDEPTDEEDVSDEAEDQEEE